MQNNSKKIYIGIIILVLILTGIFVYIKKNNVTNENVNKNQPAKLVVTDVGTEVLGHTEDLLALSIMPGSKVSGIVNLRGVLKGGYFFEGNVPIAILNANKEKTPYGPGHGTALTDWMTQGEVSFLANFDFSLMPKGPYYIRIMQDDPSDGANGKVPKEILIPIVVE